MTLKNKALLYNFLCFAILFFVFRFFVLDYLYENRIVKSIVSALITMIIAPKFAVLKNKEGSRIVMKWLFSKSIKKL
ncbi:hypothetical protein [Cellulophaga sp. Z1A5H]|uniref:hypothetical protein n=1 Tax=Cellulophaga sp. Z1A5H TaxID=2687291 RepID=UPI0013FD1997|nr:hypothetical protein [Cellulophaga sp. Z1A5H]